MMEIGYEKYYDFFTVDQFVAVAEPISVAADESGPHCHSSQTCKGEEDSASTIRSVPEARDVVQNTKLVVGLHPDEAAGEIVAFAKLVKEKTGRVLPFAVVPCCVHAKTFPKRKLKNGKLVRQVQDLVQWLVELYGEGASTCTLDFEGQNVCVYCLP